MSKTFNGPNCAAPLDYDDSPTLTITGSFCQSSVLVPAELRTEASFTLANLPDIAGQSQNVAERARLGRWRSTIRTN